MDISIYEVTRADYTGFVEQIKPECRRVETNEIDDTHVELAIYSNKTNKLLCKRSITQDAPEKYYIFEMPDDDERQAPIPKYLLKLNTKEEVQAFFDFIAKQNKEHQNG